MPVIALQRDTEPWLLSVRAVIGQIETIIQKRIDIRGPLFAGALARMLQHILDDRVGALAVLNHLFRDCL